jgi:cytidine deaminase
MHHINNEQMSGLHRLIDITTVDNMINFREKQIKNHKGHYNHVAMIYEKHNMENPLAYGTNYLTNIYKNVSIHAEHDALLRLPENKKKNKKINIIVIRYNTKNELGNSKPCIFCLNHMYNIAKSKGYNIYKVYYSNQENNITSMKFMDLYFEEDKHVPKRYRTKSTL